MKIFGTIKDVEKIVISDPSYQKDVKCRFEHNSEVKQDYDIEININDYEETYEELAISGLDVDIYIKNNKYINTPSPLLTIHNGVVNYLKEFVIKEDFDIGMDTARISYGINEKADEICKYAYDSHTIEELLDDSKQQFCLKTGTDGYYGYVVLFKTIEDIPIFLKANGYICSDMGYTKEELKDYFINQFKIKNIEIDYEKNINI